MKGSVQESLTKPFTRNTIKTPVKISNFNSSFQDPFMLTTAVPPNSS